MPFVTTSAAPSTALYYVDVGAGTPVVLIHGWPWSHRIWESQIMALADAGYRCIAYDRRGFGDSGEPSGGYDYDTFASWVASPVATYRCITAFGTTDFRADLAKCDVPTLVVHGDADRIVPIDISGRLTAATIAGSRFEVIEGAPHGFAATHAARLNAPMLDVLR
jgi:pimeloyl-ACP methyl ester carboxylesterase